MKLIIILRFTAFMSFLIRKQYDCHLHCFLYLCIRPTIHTTKSAHHRGFSLHLPPRKFLLTKYHTFRKLKQTTPPAPPPPPGKNDCRPFLMEQSLEPTCTVLYGRITLCTNIHFCQLVNKICLKLTNIHFCSHV